MKINSIKGFKAETAENDGAFKSQGVSDDTFSEEADAWFMQGQSETKARSDNPLDDFLLGMSGESSNETLDSWLAEYPPSWGTIAANFDRAKFRPKLILDKYEKALAELKKLKLDLEEEKGTASKERQIEISNTVRLIEDSLNRCRSEIASVNKSIDTLARTHKMELAMGVDVNQDGWVGEPRVKGSYFKKVEKDGTIRYFDFEGVPTNKPLFDPEFAPQLGTGYGAEEMFEILTEGMAPIEEGCSESNLYLRLTPEAFKNAMKNDPEKSFQAVVSMLLPEVLWVKKNQNENSTEPYEMRNLKGGNMSMVPAEFSMTGGLHQEIPDAQLYTQVKAKGFKLLSESTGLYAADETELTHTVLEVYDGEVGNSNLICRIRIEGYVPSADEIGKNPAICQLENGESYVAASTASYSFSGDERISPVQFDAKQFNSTCRATHEDMGKYLGIKVKQGGEDACKWTMDAFSRDDETFKDFYTDGYNAAFCGNDFDYCENDTDPKISNRTGVFIDGLRGDLKLTPYNDAVKIGAANHVSDFMKAHSDEKTKKLRSGDPFYNTFVDCGNGRNAVYGAEGNLHVFGVTCGQFDNPGMTYIATTHFDAGSTAGNPHCYISSTMGQNWLYNPIEEDKLSYDKMEEDEKNKSDAKFEGDDFFYLKNYCATDPDDVDLQNKQSMFNTEPAGDMAAFRGFLDKPLEDFLKELTAEPELDPSLDSVEELDFGDFATEMVAELDAFFAMYGSELTDTAAESGLDEIAEEGI